MFDRDHPLEAFFELTHNPKTMQHDASAPPHRWFDDVFLVDQYDRREDLDVQVKMTANGRWHRKAIGGLATACGLSLNAYATRTEQYGPSLVDMCDRGCFHPYELAQIPKPPASESPDPPSQTRTREDSRPDESQTRTREGSRPDESQTRTREGSRPDDEGRQTMPAPTIWMDVQSPTEAAEVVAGEMASDLTAAPTLAVGSGVRETTMPTEGDADLPDYLRIDTAEKFACPDDFTDEDVKFLRSEAMLDEEMSTPRGPRSRPIPTAVVQAIQEGYPLGAPGTAHAAPSPAMNSGVVASASSEDDEKSVPVNLRPHDEVVYRLRKLEAGHVELGRAVGQISADIRTGFAELSGSMREQLGSLVTYADLTEKRAAAKELAESNARAAIAAAEINAAAAANAARVEGDRARTIESGHNVELTKARLSYREKIQLAIIGLLTTVFLGYLALNHVTVKQLGTRRATRYTARHGLPAS